MLPRILMGWPDNTVYNAVFNATHGSSGNSGGGATLAEDADYEEIAEELDYLAEGKVRAASRAAGRERVQTLV